MGSLGGHLIPGTFFLLFGIWWSFITSLRYVKSKFRNQLKKNSYNGYKSTVTMPCVCCPCDSWKRAPIESYVKLILPFLGVLVEFFAGFEFPNPNDPKGHEMSGEHANMAHSHNNTSVPTWTFAKGNLQHITMYSSFMFGALVEILIHNNVDLPSRIEFVFGMVGFSIEAFLFGFHLHGKAALEINLHVILIYAVFGCIITSALEIYNPKQILFTYGRILFTIAQGTWFYQVGFMLYPPTKNPAHQWDLNDHGNVLIATVIFCWHILLIMLGLLIELWLIRCCLNRSKCIKNSLNELIVYDQNISSRLSQGYGLLSKSPSSKANDPDNDSESDQDRTEDTIFAKPLI